MKQTLVTLCKWYIKTQLAYAAPILHSGLTVRQKKKIFVCWVILEGDYSQYQNALQTPNLEIQLAT